MTVGGAAEAYYRACAGRWGGRLDLRITAGRRLRRELGWLRALSYRALAWLPSLRLRTSVAVREPTVVQHTTELRWGPLRLLVGEERLLLDGAAVRLEGQARQLGGRREAITGTAEVSEGANSACYTIALGPVPLEQTASLVDDRVTLRQVGPGFVSEVVLTRR